MNTESTLFSIEPEMRRDARISPCGLYRVGLKRFWGDGQWVNFIMLNPSTADANIDDPTIRRCVGFARSWGYDALIVTNLFAYRATDPKVLKSLDYETAVGPTNDAAIIGAADGAAATVCAWGSNPTRGRDQEVLALLRKYGHAPLTLRLTKDGHPSHPLYLPASCRPVAF